MFPHQTFILTVRKAWEWRAKSVSSKLWLSLHTQREVYIQNPRITKIANTRNCFSQLGLLCWKKWHQNLHSNFIITFSTPSPPLEELILVAILCAIEIDREKGMFDITWWLQQFNKIGLIQYEYFVFFIDKTGMINYLDWTLRRSRGFFWCLMMLLQDAVI